MNQSTWVKVTVALTVTVAVPSLPKLVSVVSPIILPPVSFVSNGHSQDKVIVLASAPIPNSTASIIIFPPVTSCATPSTLYVSGISFTFVIS